MFAALTHRHTCFARSREMQAPRERMLETIAEPDLIQQGDFGVLWNIFRAVIPAREWPASSARDGFLDSGFRRNDDEIMKAINGTAH